MEGKRQKTLLRKIRDKTERGTATKRRGNHDFYAVFMVVFPPLGLNLSSETRHIHFLRCA